MSVSSWVTQLASESVHPCGCNFCKAALLLSRTPSVIYARNFIKNVMRYVYGYKSLRESWDLLGVLSRVDVVAKKYERTESGRRRLRDAFTAYRVKISWILQLAWQNGTRTVISSVMNMQVIFLFLFLLFPFLFSLVTRESCLLKQLWLVQVFATFYCNFVRLSAPVKDTSWSPLILSTLLNYFLI